MRKLIFFLVILSFFAAQAQEKKKVMIMEIRQEIDPRTLRYVKLALENAVKTKADYVIVDMDSYGGTVIDAKEIVQEILLYK
ncbi:MAG TPA: nodulation protein NfeD, partial [Cyclobacteriaceae bacterium]|nr:nodulation protein NfeD [Cyclobacteriaceae bacterium]